MRRKGTAAAQRKTDAEEEERARRESECRRQRIEILWQHLKNSPDCARKLVKDQLGATLIELADLQRQQISEISFNHGLCEWAETHAPKELNALKAKHPLVRSFRAVLARMFELTPKQTYERRTRRRHGHHEVGLIEYEFGGLAAAKAGFPCDTSCLDQILAGGEVTMSYLQVLFGMERHRFPKNLPRTRSGRQILYSALAVAKIMDALLMEKIVERNPDARGGSLKKIWPSNPDRRKRMLFGIGSRAYFLAGDKDIRGAFMVVVCYHLSIACPKYQLPNGFDDWLTTVRRRYLG